MSLTASYYVSSAATPGTGDGSLGSPYALADLSIVGGSYKTVGSTDIVAMIADGAYTLPANMTVTTGTNNFCGLRGCKTDGTFDYTRATKATINVATYTITLNTYGLLADLTIQSPTGSQTYMIYQGGDYGLFYNVHALYGSGTASVCTGFLCGSGADRGAFVACSATDMTGIGFNIGGYNAIYCIAKNCTRYGFTDAATNAYGLMAHCIADGCTSNGFVRGAPGAILHCLAVDCTGIGFSAYYGPMVGCIALRCGSYGYSEGTSGNGSLAVGCIGYQNTSGLYINNGWDWSTQLQEIDPNLDAYYTAQSASVPTLGELLGMPSGRNRAGALTLAGSGGGGPVPMIGSPFLRRVV